MEPIGRFCSRKNLETEEADDYQFDKYNGICYNFTIIALRL